MSEQNSQQPTVTRTYRAAIRHGDDYMTLEETITLPIDASDSDVEQAVALGWRIYQVQHTAVQAQIAELRASIGPPAPVAVRHPDLPPTDKQRGLISSLQQSLAWDDQQLDEFARSQRIALATMNRAQASELIDLLKQEDDQPGTMSEQQHQALQRLAHERQVDLEALAQQHFGVAVVELDSRQAGDLIRLVQR